MEMKYRVVEGNNRGFRELHGKSWGSSRSPDLPSTSLGRNIILEAKAHLLARSEVLQVDRGNYLTRSGICLVPHSLSSLLPTFFRLGRDERQLTSRSSPSHLTSPPSPRFLKIFPVAIDLDTTALRQQ